MSDKVNLVGLVGNKGAGKDTAAAGLCARGWRALSYAGPLREAVQALFLLPDEACEDPVRKELPGPLGVSYRRAMQVMGTDFIRMRLKTLLPEGDFEDGGFWLAHMRRQVDAARAAGVPAVVTDVRFPNEAQLILELGGKLVLIERGKREADAAERGWLVSDSHPSETGVTLIRESFGRRLTVLANDGSPVELREKLRRAVENAEQ